MKRILKHVKPYIFLILIAIGLLFTQANLELSLPDYMSDIVDKGIQQGGVEYAVPIAIRESKMENIFVFVDPENQTKVLSDYRLITENSNDYSELLDSYPILENESIYLLNEHIKKKTIEEHEEILINAIVTSTVFEQIAANNSQVVNATEIYELLGIDR
ncbi:MAG: hypothetical protein ACTSPP_10910 [Candidatus Heimdallarchaeaceae archaeon]